MKINMHRWGLGLALVAATLLAAGCASQKEPATKAVADIEASLSSLQADASEYASAELQPVEDALASLKTNLANNDYKAVLAAAPAVSSQVAALQQTVAQKKEEAQAALAAATEKWQSLSADVPNMLSAIQSRVDVLSKSKKLPKNVSADAFQSAKDGLAELKSNWDEASAAFTAGKATDAVAKAEAAKAKGAEVLKLLGMG